MDLRDVDGMSALHVASVAGNRAICEYLLSDVHVNSNCKVRTNIIYMWASMVGKDTCVT